MCLMHVPDDVPVLLESGAPPPDGVTLRGRWFALGHDRGFMVVESDEPAAIFRWTSSWASLVDFEVHPVIDDATAGEVLGSM
jgi:hypothetical protein